MAELSATDRAKLFAEFRQEGRRRRTNYVTMSAGEARRLGYHAVTSAFSTRQFDQCDMLDRVIADFKGADIKLVRVGVRKNRIEVWRK